MVDPNLCRSVEAGELKTVLFRLIEAKILDVLPLLSIRVTWNVGMDPRG